MNEPATPPADLLRRALRHPAAKCAASCLLHAALRRLTAGTPSHKQPRPDPTTR
ncbi:hypothetical protein [Embleya sp. NPDC005575]|uniref:hypothetical protein n=1 Tax=Embleya sp. NPDC005575 TaxID=3156892 RepID=UPI0033ABDAAB